MSCEDYTKRFQPKVAIVKGSIICGDRGGSIRCCGGDIIEWSSDRNQPFTLRFFREAEECPAEITGGDASTAQKELGASADPDTPPERLDPWPFSDPPRPVEPSTPDSYFKGVVKDEPAVYKYHVTIGNLRLDPIIIVDKRGR